MKIYLVTILLFLSSLSFGENIYENRFRILGSVWTRHESNNDVYNNDNDLLGIEYFITENTSLGFAYFENSFYNDSYLLAVNHYLRPFSHKRIFLSGSAGIIKGYEKENIIVDKRTGEELKKSKFNTNFYKDYIVGGSVGVGYDITDNFAVSLNYTGAYIMLLHLKI
ncbi:MAG: hypothetical protein ACRCTS_08990 [Fusobacteriaceae bacterium]